MNFSIEWIAQLQKIIELGHELISKIRFLFCTSNLEQIFKLFLRVTANEEIRIITLVILSYIKRT